jgi:AmmeMemoRadiSam system protein B
LKKQLSDWLDAARDEVQGLVREKNVTGIIAPHAGYYYSGATAAYAYAGIKPSNFKRVFILGPSHAWHLTTCALPEATEYETPFGNLKVDEQVVKDLRDTGLFLKFEMSRDEREHSLEMHMPYIAHVMAGQDFTIVPILVGSTDAKAEKKFGELLASYVNDTSNLFVVSSDFCHWGERFGYQPHDNGEVIHKTISDLDHEGMELIEKLQTENFQEYLQRTQNTICGRHPIAVFMNALNTSTRTQELKFIRYAQSSQVTKVNDSSVSYASAIVTQVST